MTAVSIFQELGLEWSEDEIEEWLETDNNDHGYAHLNDDEINSDIIEKPTQEETQEPEDADDAIQTTRKMVPITGQVGSFLEFLNSNLNPN